MIQIHLLTPARLPQDQNHQLIAYLQETGRWKSLREYICQLILGGDMTHVNQTVLHLFTDPPHTHCELTVTYRHNRVVPRWVVHHLNAHFVIFIHGD